MTLLRWKFKWVRNQKYHEIETSKEGSKKSESREKPKNNDV